jgi:uncharacterized protein (DUF983 family)
MSCLCCKQPFAACHASETRRQGFSVATFFGKLLPGPEAAISRHADAASRRGLSVPAQQAQTCGANKGFDMTESQTAAASAQMSDRPTWPAVFKGWRRKCPNCGKGAVLHSYLKVNDHCSACGEELFHHRADDGPAYLTILIVGHLLAPLLHIAYVAWRPEPLVMFTLFTIGCITLSLYLLPRLKGVVVAYQWARRMHGFDKRQ